MEPSQRSAGLLLLTFLLALALGACSNTQDELIATNETTHTTPKHPVNTATQGVWNPFQPGGTTSEGEVNFTVNGNVSGIAWNQQRCYSYGDSLPLWPGGSASIRGTSKGRLKWAMAYTSGMTFPGDQSGNTYGTYYDQIDPENGNVITDNQGRALQLYPSFAALNASNDPVLDPAYNPNRAGGVSRVGMAPADPTVFDPGGLGAGYQLVAFCIPSCYRGNQKLLFTREAGQPVSLAVPIEIAKAMEGKVPFRPQGVVTLAADAVLGALNLTVSPVTRFISDRAVADPEPQLFYQFTFRSGNVLEVTEQHGLITPDGRLHTAQEIAQMVQKQGVGNVSLLSATAGADPIVKVEAPRFRELAYNVLVGKESDENLRSHIVSVANGGYLAADAFLQNNVERVATQLNRELDRENVPTELLALGRK